MEIRVRGHLDEAASIIADRRTGPGIVVLSVTMQLLYMNQAAHHLICEIQEARQQTRASVAAQGIFPPALTRCAGRSSTL